MLLNANGGTMDRERLIVGRVLAGQSVPDAMTAALAGAVEVAVKREDDALYQYESFPGPGTESLYVYAQKATLRAWATYRQHVLDREKKEGRRL